MPKVELPIDQIAIPYVHVHKNDNPYICSYTKAYLNLDNIKDSRTGEVYENHYAVDLLVEPKVKKMTIAEIEEKLGYKIEIVDKKE